MTRDIGIYIHIPFCERKCPYCDFYSVKYDEMSADIYTEKVCDTIRKMGKRFSRTADTLYFGGGTPSVMGADRIGKICHAVKESFSLAEYAEVTAEVNPSREDIDFEKLREYGVNRISIGLQSANDEELRQLGRLHNVSQAKRCIQRAKEAGFGNISLDLMIATPQQTMTSLAGSIAFCAEEDVQHISAYILKIEEGTEYAKIQKSLSLMNDDEQAEMYLMAAEKLQEYGYRQYEISNFCKEGYESRHNLKYWHDEEYIGIGASAHSFIDGKRFFYGRSFEDFYAMKIVWDGNGGSMEEYIMLALRLTEGLRQDLFQERFGMDIPKEYIARAEKFCGTDLLIVDSQGIRLTPKGFLLSNYIIAEILQ